MNLSIILPIYNEESVIKETIDTTFVTVSKYCKNLEIIAVNDRIHEFFMLLLAKEF